MPSQPLDTGWDFNSVIHLIDSDVHDASSPRLRPSPTRPLPSALQGNGGVRLGSFAKLYEDLGYLSISQAQLPLDPESELSNSDDALLPSPVHEGFQSPEDHAGDTEQKQFKPIIKNQPEPLLPSLIHEDIQSPMQCDDTANITPNATIMSKKQRKRARRRAEKEQDEDAAQAPVQNSPEEKNAQGLTDSPKHNVCAIIASSKAPQAPSGSDVDSKIKSPTPILAIENPLPKTSMPQKEPKTPKLPRPTLGKRSSTAQRGAARRNHSIDATAISKVSVPDQAVPAPQPLSLTMNHSVVSVPVPFEYPLAPPFTAQLQLSQLPMQPGHHGLIPSTVRPIILPRSFEHSVGLSSSISAPLISLSPVPFIPMTHVVIRSQVDRHFHLFNQLLHRFPDDHRWLVSPRQLVNENITSHGLHIFVDASNIMYGFRDVLRNYGLHPYDMSFDSLALLMERRRPVAKRVFAGSHREANPVPQVTKLVESSRAVGYESNVKEQVLIVREETQKKKFFNDVKKLGWQKAQQIRSGSGSDSETGMPAAPKTPSAPKWVEQGVDEILHLKMCQSIIDSEVASTMVLATGDGAEAEMSDGFLAHVERALRKGWKVELISWRQQINGGYRNRKFRAKWAEQFKIIELDDFLEDLIDTP